MAGETQVHIGRAFRITMAWQAAATTAVAAIAAVAAGSSGLLSALLGGGIGMAGVLVFALMSARSAASPGGTMRIALRAEAARIIVVVLLLWLVFVLYRGMMVLPFFSAFILAVLLSGIAFAVSGD